MRRPVSRKNAPGSSRAAIRSRAVSFPARCWRSIRVDPPPSRRRASSFCNCSTRRRMCAWRAMSTLFDLREVGRIHVNGDHLLDDFAVGLRIGRNLLPLRIIAELLPVLIGGGAALVGDDVDQSGVLALVLRNPVPDTL